MDGHLPSGGMLDLHSMPRGTPSQQLKTARVVEVRSHVACLPLPHAVQSRAGAIKDKTSDLGSELRPGKASPQVATNI